MKEKKLTRSVMILGEKAKCPPKGEYKVVKTSKLPPLSMELYASSRKQLQKKKKQVHRSIQEAESIMAVELGRALRKSQGRFILGGWKIK